MLANGIVVFNQALNGPSGANITLNTLTGVFTINRTGTYYVSWWVAEFTAGASPWVSFAVQVIPNFTPEAAAYSPVTFGQLSGSALISVGVTNTTVRLINHSTDTVTYADSTAQAGIVILEVTP